MKLKAWLNKKLLGNIPSSVIAFHFNLYESEKKNRYMAELVGCDRYCPDDADWACEISYSSGKNLYEFTSDDWQSALQSFVRAVSHYLDLCDATNRLKQAQYITAGFVDGDLVVIEQ